MKTKEFIEKVEALGYEFCGTYGSEKIRDIDERIYILKDDQNLLFVDMTTSYLYDSRFDIFKKLNHEEKEVLMPIVFKFVSTPLAEREEEKRYWLRKIPVPLLKESADLYYYEPSNKLFAPGVDRNRTDNEKFKSIFTESEISQMDITGFEKVEVSE